MKYFTLEELCNTKTGITNIPSWQAVENLKALVNNVLDPVRESWGKPIIVTSGFRCKTVNDKVGGSKNSQHTKGQAVDLDCKNKNYNKKMYELLRTFDIDQCINEKDYEWIHVSYRLDGKNRNQYLNG